MAKKTPSASDAVKMGAELIRGAAKPKRETKRAAAAEDAAYTTTSIHIPEPILHILQDVALKRSRTGKGRMSVSALIVELVEQHLDELTREVRGSRPA